VRTCINGDHDDTGQVQQAGRRDLELAIAQAQLMRRPAHLSMWRTFLPSTLSSPDRMHSVRRSYHVVVLSVSIGVEWVPGMKRKRVSLRVCK